MMVVRLSAFRPIAGFSTIAKTTLTSLALAGGIAAATSPAFAAPTGWGNSSQKSVLIQSNGRRIPTPYTSQSTSPEFPQGGPVEEIGPGQIATDSYDGGVQSEDVIVGSPSESYGGSGYDEGSSSPGYSNSTAEDGTYGNAVEGVYSSPFNGSYEGGFEGQEPGPLPCGEHCNGQCNACQQGSCGLPEWRYNAECEPMGLLQKMYLLHRGIKSDGCWTGRVDALILSRNAPGNRPLYIYSPAGGTALNANQLESIAAVGPRLSLFHTDSCGKASWEGTYIYSGSFVANKSLTPAPGGYLLAPPGIYDPFGGGGDFDGAAARLTSSLQSAELNRRWGLGSSTQFLAGFRWLQWQETLAINDAYGVATGDIGQNVYTNGCYNNLFGGQIGLDTALWRPSKHFRLEGLVKAGAYYNSAYQSSSYQNYAGGVTAGNSVSVGQSPAVCSFAGELGLTGVIPVCCNVDFRFGYFGLWLSSLAQPANQLSNQILIPDQPAYGSLATNGNVALQGLSLGLEGRW